MVPNLCHVEPVLININQCDISYNFLGATVNGGEQIAWRVRKRYPPPRGWGGVGVCVSTSEAAACLPRWNRKRVLRTTTEIQATETNHGTKTRFPLAVIRLHGIR
ncbi:hypothetical protein FKM82_028879 [Ascaphus truei]